MAGKEFYRVIDVNLNRAKEGIRVVEDTMRLVKNDIFFLAG